jgi:hypothetical protein
MWQQLVEPGHRMVGNAGEYILEPGEGVDFYQLAGGHETRSTAAVRPLRSLPKKVQLLRPTAKHRTDRSVALLSSARSGFSQ